MIKFPFGVLIILSTFLLLDGIFMWFTAPHLSGPFVDKAYEISYILIGFSIAVIIVSAFGICKIGYKSENGDLT